MIPNQLNEIEAVLGEEFSDYKQAEKAFIEQYPPVNIEFVQKFITFIESYEFFIPETMEFIDDDLKFSLKIHDPNKDITYFSVYGNQQFVFVNQGQRIEGQLSQQQYQQLYELSQTLYVS